MTDMMIALLILSAVVCYWVLCRKTAFKYQALAVEIMEKYFDNEEVPEEDKDALYEDYRMSRSWYFLPFIALVTPFVLAADLIKKQDVRPSHTPRVNQDVYDEAFSAMNKMMIIKNPLVSILSLSFAGICFAVAIPIGIAMNRMGAISEVSNPMGFFNKISGYAKRKAHMH